MLRSLVGSEMCIRDRLPCRSVARMKSRETPRLTEHASSAFKTRQLSRPTAATTTQRVSNAPAPLPRPANWPSQLPKLPRCSTQRLPHLVEDKCTKAWETTSRIFELRMMIFLQGIRCEMEGERSTTLEKYKGTYHTHIKGNCICIIAAVVGYTAQRIC